LGQIGHGYKYAIGILNEGRIGIAAQVSQILALPIILANYNIKRKKCSKTNEYLETCEHKMAPFPCMRRKNRFRLFLSAFTLISYVSIQRTKRWLSDKFFCFENIKVFLST
jgi:hypothetical protein